MAGDETHQQRVLAQARLLAVTRDEGVAEYRETIRLLTTILAISPHVRPTFDAPPGRLGRPSEQWEPCLPPDDWALRRIPRPRGGAKRRPRATGMRCAEPYARPSAERRTP